MRITRQWNEAEVQSAEERLFTAIWETHRETEELALVAIANGGVQLCQRLWKRFSERLAPPPHLGVVDITFYRDDIGQKPFTKITSPTDLAFVVDGATIILVDDVLCSGRTVRAALGEIFDQGRPALVELAVLFDRMNYRLPIRPDYTGMAFATRSDDRVAVQLGEVPGADDHIALHSET